jgi:exodeoxyribonuclease X
MSAIILDTEATGLTEPDVIELAYVDVPHLEPNQAVDAGQIVSMRFHPRKPISPAAMAVHNIILEDLTASPTWPGSWRSSLWDQPGQHFVIGHGIDFDWEAIGSPPEVLRIDTLSMCRFMYPDADSHKLTAMIYHLMPADHARIYVAGAHGAAADVGMTWLLLGFLLDKAEVDGLLHPDAIFPDLYALSEMCRIPVFMDFGKYGPYEAWGKQNGGKGMRCSQVKAFDPSYYGWLMSKCDKVTENPYLQRALSGK